MAEAPAAPPTAPPATPPTTPPAAPPVAPPASTWHGIADATEAAYVQNKGWQSPADVIKSYKGAEQLIGRDPSTLIAMPRLDDPAGFRQVMQKLGLPETPEKYDFGKPAAGQPSFDEAYVGWAKQTFHKLGLPADMAKQLIAANGEYVKGVIDKQTADYNLKVTGEKTALQAEWGGGFERMFAAAKAAASTLGFTPEMADALESSIGYGATMKFFAQLGQKLGEDGFVTGTKSPQFSGMLTPAEAKAQWDGKLLDPAFTAALKDKSHPGHKVAAEQQTKLFAIMFPEK